jgi:autoinducer 2-degrading protein
MAGTLLVVYVHVHVKPDAVDAFVAATLANSRSSLQEPGVVRFDITQELADPTRFVLCEVYRGAAGAQAHKETRHYATWRDTVAPMMEEQRRSVKYVNLFPEDEEY